MGVRDGAFVRLWSARENDYVITCQATCSRKRKDGDGYDNTFQGFISFFGDVCKDKIRSLGLPEESDRNNPVGKSVKIVGSPDVTTWYNRETKKGGMNVTVYDVELQDDSRPAAPPAKAQPKKSAAKTSKSSPVSDDSELPF